MTYAPYFLACPGEGVQGENQDCATPMVFPLLFPAASQSPHKEKKAPCNHLSMIAWNFFYLLVCILLITFSLVNSSLSFSSSAFWIFFVRASYIGIVMFFQCIGPFLGLFDVRGQTVGGCFRSMERSDGKFFHFLEGDPRLVQRHRWCCNKRIRSVFRLLTVYTRQAGSPFP